jgi:5-methylcytosine-specific restriction endonuclease McrA
MGPEASKPRLLRVKWRRVIRMVSIVTRNDLPRRLRVFERDEYKCPYCQEQLTHFTATLDHVKPVAEGGDNSFDNLVTACLNCNSQKHRRPVSEFLAER